MGTIANKKKTSLLDPRSSACSLSRRPSCSANNHDISGKLKHFACFTCSLLFCENSYFEVNSMTEKFNSVSPKLFSPLNLVLLSVTFFIQFGSYKLPLEQLFTVVQNNQNSQSSISGKPSINVTISPRFYLTFSFNPSPQWHKLSRLYSVPDPNY